MARPWLSSSHGQHSCCKQTQISLSCVQGQRLRAGVGTGRQTQASSPHATPNPAWGHWPQSSSPTPTTSLAHKRSRKQGASSPTVPSPLWPWPLSHLCRHNPPLLEIPLPLARKHSQLTSSSQQAGERKETLFSSPPVPLAGALRSPRSSRALQSDSLGPCPSRPRQPGSGRKPRAPRGQADGHSLTASDTATCPFCWAPLLPQRLQQAWPADQF